MVFIYTLERKADFNVGNRYPIKTKIKIFRGPENNLVERYYLAAKKYNVRNIIRFPGDNCIPEPKEIDRIIKLLKDQI